MTTNQPDPERNKQLADMYAEGYMYETIASAFGITKTRVIQILNGLGVRKPKWRWSKPDTVEKIYQMKVEDRSQAVIGREVGLSRERIRQILNGGRKTV